jgi:DNA-binding transcriptional regulator/RsmH inhibitor MraZ
MSGEFLGTFYGAVNKQKWIVIPSALKKEFSPTSKQNVIITCGPIQIRNIVIYPLDIWKEKSNKTDPKSRELYDYMLNTAFSCQLEPNGRIKLDDTFLIFGNIKDKVVIKGEGSYISVWSPEIYDIYQKQFLQNYQTAFTMMDYRL